MRVKEVYQDEKGNWHIDYDFDHLMGLSIRVWFGGLLIYLKITIYAIIFSSLSIALFYLFTSVRNNYSPKEKNHSSFLNVQPESIKKNKQLYRDRNFY